ncbi:MAG: GNAT family N-acetyltransferase [Bryobacteraceae bacterium]
MAALSDQRPSPLVDLREVSSAYLQPVLEAEIDEWRTGLDWDFTSSADLVRRFVDMRALTGFALPGGTHAAGYAYHVCEDGKGLIGSLYVAPGYRTIENEDTLLSAVLDTMLRTLGTRRIEAQLMMISSPLDRLAPYPKWFRPYARKFLEASLANVSVLPPREPSVVIAPWHENRQDETARLIAQAYTGHIDSQINDQYRSPGGARRFLTNIVQYPGCGAFFPGASFVAFSGAGSGRALCGACLASLVAPEVGHITQVCVSPAVRGTGLGYELMRRSLVALAGHGCRSVSLTVTASNSEAIRLYERMGFRTRRDFAAYVWEIR